MVIFSHGLGGNRALYAEHGAAYAAQVSAVPGGGTYYGKTRIALKPKLLRHKLSMFGGRLSLPWVCSCPYFDWIVGT